MHFLNSKNNDEDDGPRHLQSFYQTTTNTITATNLDESIGVTSFSVGSCKDLTAAQINKVINWWTRDEEDNEE